MKQTIDNVKLMGIISEKIIPENDSRKFNFPFNDRQKIAGYLLANFTNGSGIKLAKRLLMHSDGFDKMDWGVLQETKAWAKPFCGTVAKILNQAGFDMSELGVDFTKQGKLLKTTDESQDTNQGKQNGQTPPVVNTLFQRVENYLSKMYDFRNNIITNTIELKLKNEEVYKEINENNIYRKLQLENISVSLNNLISLLRSDFVTSFNPFTQYFSTLVKWDK